MFLIKPFVAVWPAKVSQRSLHNAPIFRLLLKVAVNGTHQCDFLNFCGQQCPTVETAPSMCEALQNRLTSGVSHSLSARLQAIQSDFASLVGERARHTLGLLKMF